MRWTSQENHDRRLDTDTAVAAQLALENKRARLARWFRDYEAPIESEWDELNERENR